LELNKELFQMRVELGHNNGNPGIVPPWLGKTVVPAAKNPGIVPPWLTDPITTMGKNPGIVPPWLQPPAVRPATLFVREPIDHSPHQVAGFSRY
jgi:hypothetical protein